MSTIRFNKTSALDVQAALLAKFRHLFIRLTGYDLMFEASRTDIKPITAKGA